MPQRRLDDWIEGWMTLQENSESPNLYKYWTAISLVASALSRKVWHTWDKKIYPNFFILLIGPPGFRKGTAMGPGSKFLFEVGIETTSDSVTRAHLIEELEQSRRSVTLNNGEVEYYCPLTIFSEEFTVFLGQDNKQLMSDLCDLYDCKDRWRYGTKGSGKYLINGVFVNLMGATTPELFQSSLPDSAVGSGLLSRILCVFEDERSHLVIFPHKQTLDFSLEDDLKHDFAAIGMMKGEFEFSAEFDRRYAEWYPEQDKTTIVRHPKLQAYIMRRPTHMRKLAMISAASRSNEMIVTEEDFERALTLLQLTEKKMDKVFSGMGGSDNAKVMYDIAEFIMLRGKCKYSEVVKKFMLEADRNALAVIISTLMEGGIVKKTLIQGNTLDFWLEYVDQRDEKKG